MFKRTLILAGSLLFAFSAFAADDPQLKIVKPQGRFLRPAAGTGLQGTLSLTGSTALSCGDLTVHVGILHANSPTLTSFASAPATETSGRCSYSITPLPAGGPFNVVVVPDATKGCRLPEQGAFGPVTLTRGSVAALDIELAPVCETR